MRNVIIGLTVAFSATVLSATGIAPAFASAQAPSTYTTSAAGVITL